MVGSLLMRAGIVLTLLAAIGLVAGCGSETAGSDMTVIAAFYPIAYAVERVAPSAEVENLTPVGAEPHDLELSPRDVERINDADVALYFGNGFMPALEDAVEGREAALDLLAGEDLQEAAAEPALDPHVWLDPMRYGAIVRKVAAALAEPTASDELVAELESLDEEFRAGLATCERRQFVTSHAAFGYLADAYDLEQIPLAASRRRQSRAHAREGLVDDVEEEGRRPFSSRRWSRPSWPRGRARGRSEDCRTEPTRGLTEGRSRRRRLLLDHAGEPRRPSHRPRCT